jgi:hypothetical protein
MIRLSLLELFNMHEVHFLSLFTNHLLPNTKAFINELLIE